MVTPQLLAGLAQSWDQLMSRCNVMDSTQRASAWEQLVACYSEPHRYYHNLNHISYMLDGLAGLCDPASLVASQEACNVLLATWYHDVVYDTHRSDNEERSAETAIRTLREWNLPEDCIARVGNLIRMTKHHQAPVHDIAGQWLLDADLSILSGEPADYRRYADEIRKEYFWVPEREFYSRRRAILRKFQARPVIYHTQVYREWESAARANLTDEITQIDELLRQQKS